MRRLFGKERPIQARQVPEGMRPVIKSSICTGEKVAGFVDGSGKFEDVMLISAKADMEEFCRRYGLEEKEVGKIW